MQRRRGGQLALRKLAEVGTVLKAPICSVTF